MTHVPDPSGAPGQPALADLAARYLQRQAAAHAEGLGLAEPSGEVVPHEAVPSQPIDPRLARDEALAALRAFDPELPTGACEAPPEWSELVAGAEPAAALAFAAGHFPQLVRNLQPLLHTTDLRALRPAGQPAADRPGLVNWARQAAAKRPGPQALLAAGALRLARQFDAAAELLRRERDRTPSAWQAAWANEEAALAWHRGDVDRALALWQAQPESAPVLFNRGVAALFSGKPADARTALAAAAAQLPEAGAWHHLGRLYLALAEMRG
jgi:tetratricopeptide (TPR) repeat protein